MSGRCASDGVCVLLLIVVVLSGCVDRRGHTMHGATVNWDAPGHAGFLNHTIKRRDGEVSGPLLSHGTEKQIAGKPYKGYLLLDVSEEPTAEELDAAIEDPDQHVVEVWSRRLDDPHGTIDIFIHTRIRFELDWDPHEGSLRAVENGEVLTRPHVLKPGNYHLHAIPE